jgi:hypothetical protein
MNCSINLCCCDFSYYSCNTLATDAVAPFSTGNVKISLSLASSLFIGAAPVNCRREIKRKLSKEEEAVAQNEKLSNSVLKFYIINSMLHNDINKLKRRGGVGERERSGK